MQEEAETQKELSSWRLKVAKVKAEWEIFQKKNVHVTLNANIDYTSQNEVLKKKIDELK